MKVSFASLNTVNEIILLVYNLKMLDKFLSTIFKVFVFVSVCGKSLYYCGPIESPPTQSDQLLKRLQSVEHL